MEVVPTKGNLGNWGGRGSLPYQGKFGGIGEGVEVAPTKGNLGNWGHHFNLTWLFIPLKTARNRKVAEKVYDKETTLYG